MNIGGIGAYNKYGVQSAYGGNAVKPAAAVNKEAEIEAIRALKLDRKTERLAIVNVEEKNMTGDEAVINAKEERNNPGGAMNFKEIFERAKGEGRG